MISSAIRSTLVTRFPVTIADELLECYSEQKRNLFLGRLRPNEVEGGRFAEAAFRMLEHFVGWTITPIGNKLDTESTIKKLQALPSSRYPDSVRLFIPRTLRVIYDIRNNRDAAHLNDGIDPNLQDSTFVSACLDWILAEFVRIAGGLTPDEAFILVKTIVTRKIPAIEDFDGFLKTLRPSLGAADRLLLLLYHSADAGATIHELSSWLKPSQRPNIRRALKVLEHEKDHIVCVSGVYKITRRGMQEIEKRGLVDVE
jgi:hypothetical protein